MSTHRKIIQETIIQFGGRFISVLLSVVALGLITRLLGPEEFGVYGTALAYLQFFAILMDFGLTVVTLDLLAKESEQTRGEFMGSLLVLRGITSVGMIALSLVLLQWFGYPDHTNQAVYAAALLFVFYSFQQVFTSIFQFRHHTAPMMASEVIGRVVMVVGTLWAYWSGAGIFAIIFWGVFGTIVTVVMMASASRREIAWVPTINVARWKYTLSYSYPIAITIAFNLIYFKADTIILSFFAEPAVVGLYVAPYKILEALIALPPLFLGLVLPKMSAAVANKNSKEFSVWLGWALEHIALIVLPMIAGVWALAPEIMEFVAGNEFRGSSTILMILIAATGIIFISNTLGYAIVSLGRQKTMIPYYAVAALSSIIIYIKAIKTFGSIGAAWTTVGVEAFMLVAAAYVVFSKETLVVSWKNLTKYLISSVIMYIVLIFIHSFIHILLLIVIGAGVYIGALAGMGGINFSQLKSFYSSKST